MVKNWKKIRIILLVFFAILQWFVYIFGLQVLTKPKINLDNIFSVNIYIFLGVIALIVFETLFSKKSDKIQKIDWDYTFFSRTQPLQFFNYLGWVLAVSFLVPMLHSYIMDSEYFVDNISMFSFGISIILSTHFTSFLFKNFIKNS